MFTVKDKFGLIGNYKTLKKAREVAYAKAEELHTDVRIFKNGKLIEIARW